MGAEPTWGTYLSEQHTKPRTTARLTIHALGGSIIITAEALDAQTFLELVVGGKDGEGYLDLGFMRPGPDGIRRLDKHEFYSLPEQWNDMLVAVEFALDDDLYFSPILYSQGYRKKEDDGAKCRVIYSDADVFDPRDFRLEPSIVVETSAGRYHGYYLLDAWHPQDEVARISTKIAKAHNLDASSGIATKLLRIPGSTNRKYDMPFTVEATDTGKRYTLEDIEKAYADVIVADRLSVIEADFPETLPERFDVLAKVPASARIDALFEWDKDTAPDPDKRSERRYELMRLLFEAGLTPPEVLVAVWPTNLADHFREQGRAMSDMWRFDVLPAFSKQEQITELEEYNPADSLTPGAFLNDEELEAVFAEPGFMDRWYDLNYAALHHKTPRQYVMGNGYMLLAAALGNKVEIMPPNVQRSIFCNLNILNLGPSSTGKTESLLFAKRFIGALDGENGLPVFIGSSATAEGLVKALQGYNARSAMLITEEVAGKFKQWQSSPSMAHAREVETEIYDNYLPRNLRAGDNTNAENVRVSFCNYMMGVDTEVEQILHTGFLKSGYLVRCLIIRANRQDFDAEEEINIAQGNPNFTQKSDPNPDLFAKQFAKLKVRDNTKGVMMFEDDAWKRFLSWRAGLFMWCESQENADILRAMRVRFAINVQKMIALLAFERQADKVQMIDVLRVLHDAESFWEYALELVENVSDSEFSRLQDEVIDYIAANGGRIKISKFHEQFSYMTVRDRADVLASLESRHVVRTENKDGQKFLVTAKGVENG